VGRTGIGEEEQWRPPRREHETGQERAYGRLLRREPLPLGSEARLDEQGLGIGRDDLGFRGLDGLGGGELLGAQSSDLVAGFGGRFLEPPLFRECFRGLDSRLPKLDVDRRLF
jgi:hypothetical protein